MSQGKKFRDPARQAQVLAELHAVQEQHGYLNEEAIDQVVARLDLPVSQVYSTASFYSLFYTQPTAKHTIQICEGLTCSLCGGGDELLTYLQQKLGIEAGESTPDGLFYLETVQCLASCGTAPAMRVNGELYENMTFGELDRLLEQLARRVEV